jgi:tRNA-specific 2-thiouridylase
MRKPGLTASLAGGDIVHQGEVVGKHAGYTGYTIGQRSGIGSHAGRMYVTGIDAEKNAVSIGGWNDLLGTTLIASQVNLVGRASLGQELRVEAQVRYKDTAAPATLVPDGKDRIRLTFDEPKRAITPGQSVVFYEGDRLLGGGVIERPA